MIQADSPEGIAIRFASHKPDERGVADMALVRSSTQLLAKLLAGTVPAGRERALALTHLEEVMFWANAGIARAPAQNAQAPEPATEPAPQGARLVATDAGVRLVGSRQSEKWMHNCPKYNGEEVALYSTQCPGCGALRPA